MATASSTAFGTSTSLFGNALAGTPAFGTSSAATQPAATGFSVGAAKLATTINKPGFSFGNTSQAPAPTTGFGLASFGAKPSASVSAFSAATPSSQPSGFGSLSATATTTSSSLFGSNLFGAKSTSSSSTATPFQLQSTSSGTQGLSLFGNTGSLAAAQPVSSSTKTSATGQKVPENPKDAQVAQPLMQVYQEVSKHIKEQRAKKDEITRYSAKLIFKANEEIASLKQLLSEVSNGMQRDAVGVDTLKGDITQELNFAEIARRLHDVPASLHHDYTAPLEYFHLLVITFESRIKTYRQQLDELEMYLSAPTQMQNFSPQDLFNVLRQLNDSFLALASQLHGIHEAIQALKSKYLRYRAVVLNDNTDAFANNKSSTRDRESGIKGSGPSPFIGLTGPSAVAMAAALNQSITGTQSSALVGAIGATTIGQTSTSKSRCFGTTGLSRSLSFSGLSSRGAGTSLSLGSSLIGSSFGDFISSSKTPQFQLQNPPGTKRGKKD